MRWGRLAVNWLCERLWALLRPRLVVIGLEVIGLGVAALALQGSVHLGPPPAYDPPSLPARVSPPIMPAPYIGPVTASRFKVCDLIWIADDGQEFCYILPSPSAP